MNNIGFDPANVNPAEFFAGDNVARFLRQFEAEHTPAEPLSMTVKKNRDSVRSAAAAIPRVKTTLDEKGKEFVAKLKEQSGAIDKQRKLLRDRLDALRDKVRQPLTDWETAEAIRIEREAMAAEIAAVYEQAHAENELFDLKAADQKRRAAEFEAERIRIEEDQRKAREAEIARIAREQAEADSVDKIRAAEQARIDAEQRAEIERQRAEAAEQMAAAQELARKSTELQRAEQRSAELRNEETARLNAINDLIGTGLMGDNAAAELLDLIAAGRIRGLRFDPGFMGYLKDDDHV